MFAKWHWGFDIENESLWRRVVVKTRIVKKIGKRRGFREAQPQTIGEDWVARL